MSAISDCRNCVKVTPLPANPPRRVCFLPAPGTHRASQGGGRGGRGASPGVGWGWGAEEELQFPVQWEPTWTEAEAAPPHPHPWLVEFLSPRGAGGGAVPQP